jgi:hypothetical protein
VQFRKISDCSDMRCGAAHSALNTRQINTLEYVETTLYLFASGLRMT